MKKLATCLVLSVLFSQSLRAQDFIGYSMSNYSGITGAYTNPASIADSRFRFDMELVGLDFNANNNYAGISKTVLTHPNLITDHNFQRLYMTELPNSDVKSVSGNVSIHLPAFMIRLNPKNSIGFTCRARAYVQSDGLEEQLAHMVYTQSKDTTQLFQTITNKQFRVEASAWTEYGLTYAHVFRDKDQHFLKAGVTVKLLQGLGAGYLYLNNFKYRLSNKDTIDYLGLAAGYAYSTNFHSDGSYHIGSTLGVGGDIGVVYEYRPDYEKYKYDMDGETNLDMRWKNKYKFKFGLSLLDVGGIRYAKQDGRDFTGDVNLLSVAKTQPKTSQALDSTINSRFVPGNTSNTFYMHLPTTINFQADYGIYKDFYAGLMGVYAFQFTNSESKIHEISKIVFVARWDHKWFGVYVPVTYDGFHNLNYGLNLRLGPIIIGSNALNAYYGDSHFTNAEVHALVKIPIPYRRVKDRDNDKVSDKKDNCPDVAGTWEFKGCPDRDGDHIPDSEDKCPDQPGTKEMHGCPDRDGDGVIDKLDSCPDVKGPVALNGCPDRDGDGVIDKLDECPDEAGLPQFKGCPDRDGDGVPDKIDRCPDKKGSIENEGCPDVFLLLLDQNMQVIQKVRQNKDGTFTFANLPDEKTAIFSIEGEDTGDLKELNLIVNGVPKKVLRGNDRNFRMEVLKQIPNTGRLIVFRNPKC